MVQKTNNKRLIKQIIKPEKKTATNTKKTVKKVANNAKTVKKVSKVVVNKVKNTPVIEQKQQVETKMHKFNMYLNTAILVFIILLFLFMIF